MTEAHKVISEYYFWFSDINGDYRIGLRILQDLDNKFCYRLSHHYQGTKQAGPYISSINSFGSEREALEGARREAFSLYNENDKGAQWVYDKTFDCID